ncbi:zinc ribbon domain-containing protein [Myxococcus sp. CA033]|nr:zinc ribbon domain-containing protein [Myxococcus sp. CA033]NTX34591.1 zinc ribbon domain-containing protein [Myxococcus sp. CA033]
MSCPHCGQPLPEARIAACPHCGRDVKPSFDKPLFSEDTAESARRTAESAGRAVQSILEDPRLRERLPGGSLPLLGSGLVAAAVLLPGLPIIGGSIGLPWSVTMLAGSILLGAREWSAAGRPVPPPLEKLAQVASHAAFLPLFTALAVTFAFLSLGFGLVPLVWVGAAVVLGYVQWRVFQASSASAPELRPSPEASRLKRWVCAGAAVCAVSLLFSWGTGMRSSTSLGGYGYDDKLVYEVDNTGRSTGHTYTDSRYTWKPGLTNTSSFFAKSGRARPGAPLVVLALMSLGLLAAVPRARDAVPPMLPYLLAGVVTLWGLLGLGLHAGPLLFLLGAVAIDVALVRAHRAASSGAGDAPPGGEDAPPGPGSAES